MVLYRILTPLASCCASEWQKLLSIKRVVAGHLLRVKPMSSDNLLDKAVDTGHPGGLGAPRSVCVVL